MPISAKILYALADPNRLRLLQEVARRPAAIRELAVKLRLTQSNASRHLKTLREAGIIEERYLSTRREQHIAAAYRPEGQTDCLDFGFCVVRFDRLKL